MLLLKNHDLFVSSVAEGVSRGDSASQPQIRVCVPISSVKCESHTGITQELLRFSARNSVLLAEPDTKGMPSGDLYWPLPYRNGCPEPNVAVTVAFDVRVNGYY